MNPFLEPEDDEDIERDPYEDYDGPDESELMDDDLCAQANDAWMRARKL